MRRRLQPQVSLSVLNGMAGSEPETAMDQHLAWGLHQLDLKDGWYGKPVERWSEHETQRVIEAAALRNLRVGCLSSCLGRADVESGEAAYRSELEPLRNLCAIARALRPERIRLVAPSLQARSSVRNAAEHLRTQHAWLFPLLGEVVDQLEDTGASVVIENESPHTAFGNPTEVLEFFRCLERPRVRMIWDIGNWWHFGCARFPTIDDGLALQPVISVLHLKGGIAEQPRGPLRWAAQLRETSWDVPTIVRAIGAGGRCRTICLNPPHGETRLGVSHDYRADLDYLCATFPEMLP